MDINGLAAIVTGGASGLGGATAAHLASLGAKVTIFDLNDVVGYLIQKVAIMGDHDEGKVLSGKVILQPFDHVEVEVVGRLIENQEFGLVDN